MSAITTHILDTAAGSPAAGIPVTLEMFAAVSRAWSVVGVSITDGDGRASDLLPANHPMQEGVYRLRFDTSLRSTFFPEVSIQFNVADTRQHYHVPLLLSPFGYSTYRGS